MTQCLSFPSMFLKHRNSFERSLKVQASTLSFFLARTTLQQLSGASVGVRKGLLQRWVLSNMGQDEIQ